MSSSTDFVLVKNYFNDNDIRYYLDLSKKYTEHAGKVGTRVAIDEKIY